MNSEIELKLFKEIEELKKQVAILKGEDEDQIPSYQYSKIRDIDLKKLFEIHRCSWFFYNLCNGAVR